jgi:hypothetical protein
MGDMVDIGCITSLDLPPDRLLEYAVGKLDGVVIMGYSKDGTEYFASSYADGGDALWIIERCKLKLLRLPDEGIR